MGQDFAITTMPQALDSARLATLEVTGRLLADSAGTRLSAVILDAPTRTSREWLHELAETASEDGDRAQAARLRALAKEHSFQLQQSVGPRVELRVAAILIRSHAGYPTQQTPIGAAYARIRVDGMLFRPRLQARVTSAQGWICQEMRQRGYSKLLTQALGESMCHAVKRARALKTAHEIVLQVPSMPGDGASAAFLESCVDELRLGCINLGLTPLEA